MRDEMIADLRRSGITDDWVDAGRFSVLSSTEIKTLTGINVRSAGYAIPYLSIAGDALTHARYRLFDPDKNFRYVAPLGSSHRVYFPPAWAASDKDTLVITEGEKKAFAGTVAGIPTIGLCGVDMWHCPSESGKPRSPEKRLHPDLIEALQVKDWQRVVVVADSDAATNGSVKHALQTLARAIRLQQRIKAEFVIIDSPSEDQKIGLDDFLVNGGSYAGLLGRAGVPHGGIRVKVPYAAGPEGDPLHYKVPFIYGDEALFPPIWEEKAVERKEKGGDTSVEVVNKPMADTPAAWYDMTYRVLHVRDGKAVDDDPALPAEEADLLCGMTDARRPTTFMLPQERQQEFLEGLGVTGDVKKLKKVVAAMKRANPVIRTGIRSPGWVHVNGHDYYVAPGLSIKSQADSPDCEYLPRADAISERHEAAYVCGGDPASHNAAARALLQNSGVASAVAFAFAGALLKPLAQEGHAPEIGILHYGGANSSGRGKTSILRTIGGLAGSAAKPGEAGTLIRGWNTTENGLEAPLERANDAFLMLDELGQAPEHTDWKSLLYMTSNGSGKNRMTKGVQARKNLRWSASIISTGEMGMYEKLKGVEPPEGILFRVVEYDYQPHEVWDHVTAECEGDQRKIADVIDRNIGQLRHHHGYTYAHYVRYVMDHKRQLGEIYANTLDTLRCVVPDDATSAFARRAKTMALVITSAYVLAEVLGDTSIVDRAQQFTTHHLWSAGMRDICKSEPARAGEGVEAWLVSVIGAVQEGRVNGLFLTKTGDLCVTTAGVQEVARRTGIDAAGVRAGLKALGFDYKAVKAPLSSRSVKAWRSEGAWVDMTVSVEGDERPF
jgi:hypothetical protein